MIDGVITFDKIKAHRAAKNDCLRQLGAIPFTIKPNGEVLTQDQHLERQRKKDLVEQAARERL